MQNLNIITCNVQGLGEVVKRRQFFQYFKQKEAHIVMIQETHAVRKKHKIWKSEWGNEIIFSDGESNARGVAILFNVKGEYEIQNVMKDRHGRYMIVNIKLNGENYCFINVYAPNEDDVEFFTTLFQQISEIDSDHLMMGGDFNKVLNLEVDKKGGKRTETKSSQVINAFLETEWCYVWRATHSDQFQFTWRRKQPSIMSSHDYFLVPYGTFNQVSHCKIHPGCVVGPLPSRNAITIYSTN